MKNLYRISILILLNSFMASAGQNGWQYGLSFSPVLNNFHPAPGSPAEAHSSFYYDSYGAAALGFDARYFSDEKWQLLTGMHFSSLGFVYGFSKSYNLIKNDHLIETRVSIPLTTIPLVLMYSFKPDCRNKRWVIGGGLNFQFLSKTSHTQTSSDVKSETSTLINVPVPQVNVVSGNKTGTGLLWMAGREKTYNRGNKFMWSFWWNMGLTNNLATSTIQYTVDKQIFTHNFINNGNSVGFRLTYYFSSKKIREKVLKDKLNYEITYK